MRPKESLISTDHNNYKAWKKVFENNYIPIIQLHMMIWNGILSV